MSFAIPNTLPAVGHPTPFSEKKFKFVRVAADSLSRLCLALFYKILSLCCAPFSAKATHRYKSLAEYQSLRAEGQWRAFRSWEKELIDFSLNTPNRVKEPLSGTETEREKLKNIYGNEAIERWSRIATKEMPLHENQISRVGIGDGCCFATSCDFISRYLQLVKTGMSPLDAVKSIAGRYVAGTPEEAQLGQIFYRGLNIDPDKLKEKYRVKPGMTQIEANQLLKDFSKTLRRLEKEREPMVARAFGLEFSQPQIFETDVTIQGNPPEKNPKFEQFVKELPEGCYNVVLRYADVHHAITFIKTTAGNHFIQEPNIGTLAVDPAHSGERLWNIAKKYHKYQAHSNLDFFPCRLN